MNVDIISNIIMFLEIQDIILLCQLNKDYHNIENYAFLWQQLIKRDYLIYNVNTHNLTTYKNIYTFENKLITNNTIRWSQDAMVLMYKLYANAFFNQYVHILNQHANNYMTSHQIVKILYKTFTNGKTLSILDEYSSSDYYQHYDQLVREVVYINNEKDLFFYKDTINDNIYYCYKKGRVRHGTTYKNYFLMVDLFMEILDHRTYYNNIYQLMLLETIDRAISYAHN